MLCSIRFNSILHILENILFKKYEISSSAPGVEPVDFDNCLLSLDTAMTGKRKETNDVILSILNPAAIIFATRFFWNIFVYDGLFHQASTTTTGAGGR